MPKIKLKKHTINPGKEEDIEIKNSRFRLYFQNRYLLISLIADLLTGFFYIAASITSLTSVPDIYGKYLYLVGAIFLTIRPLLKIFKNISIYYDSKRIEEQEQESEKNKEKKSNDYNKENSNEIH